MKQKLLMILICLFVISSINAQSGSIYFGYCDDNIQEGVGVNSQEELSAAICMPASMANIYKGKTITKIRIGLKSNSTNVSVWIRSSLQGANLVSRNVGNASQGWTEVTLSTPFTIQSNDYYIGYTATGSYNIGFSGKASEEGCWLWYNGWSNYKDSGWGSLCIQALIDTKGEAILAIGQESLPKVVQSAPKQNFSIPLSIKSLSTVDITNLKISTQIDSQTPVERIVQTNIAPMKNGTLDIPIDAISTNGIYKLTLKILEINGHPGTTVSKIIKQSNSTTDKVLYSEIRILSHSFPRKVVMEEGTGTWCGWCIRGVVGMALMKAKYPETFIGIAVHNGDPMTVTAYDNYMTANFINSFPSMVIDRKKELVGDPYPDWGAENFFKSEINLKTVAGIKLTGGFVNANKKEIALNTVTTFGITANNVNFKLAYVLIENGITGYDQANYYAGGSVMGGYEKKPNPVKDMVYNDVARGIYSEPKGITGSIPNSVKELVAVEHNYTITIPASVKDVNKLEVAVFLLDGSSGEIENADIVDIKGVFTDLPVIKTNNFSASIKDRLLFLKSDTPIESIEVYNISGQIVLSQKNYESPIAVDFLNSGVYILKTKTVEGENIIKVIM